MKDCPAVRRCGIAVLGLVLLAACGGAGSADPATTADPSTTTTAEVATTSPATTATTAATPTTTYAQAPDPPPLVLTGEDFPTIVASMVAYSEWIGVHPDPSLVANYAKENSQAWQKTTDVMTALVQSGLHGDGVSPGFVTEVRELDRVGDNVVVLYVVAVNPAFDLVDASGAVVQSFEATEPTAFSWQLEQQPDGRWFVIQRDELGPAA